MFQSVIGTNCFNVGQIHLEFSTTIIVEGSLQSLRIWEKETLFPSLQDLKGLLVILTNFIILVVVEQIQHSEVVTCGKVPINLILF